MRPTGPSAGGWSGAWPSALGQGIPGGLILGGGYLWSKLNLFAAVVLRSLINAIPGMALIRSSIGREHSLKANQTCIMMPMSEHSRDE